jgi:hypothetical protein
MPIPSAATTIAAPIVDDPALRSIDPQATPQYTCSTVGKRFVDLIARIFQMPQGGPMMRITAVAFGAFLSVVGTIAPASAQWIPILPDTSIAPATARQSDTNTHRLEVVNRWFRSRKIVGLSAPPPLKAGERAPEIPKLQPQDH